MGASDYHDQFGGTRPGSIGDDYKVYLNDAGTAVQAYRSGDQWYRPNGTPVNSPIEIFSGGLVFPKYKDESASKVSNYIKSRDFNPDASFEDYKAQINIMPRLAFSFPISEDANFFAHYDILVQRPATNTLATAVDYFYFTDNPGAIKNNPNLKPERTIDYEVGFQQKLTESSKLKVSAYYKEIRNWIQLRTFFPVNIPDQDGGASPTKSFKTAHVFMVFPPVPVHHAPSISARGRWGRPGRRDGYASCASHTCECSWPEGSPPYVVALRMSAMAEGWGEDEIKPGIAH
jgi:hypothetical protein